MTNLKFPLLLIFLFLFQTSTFTQDTFSIVAVDPATGEVGGAGATCLDQDREGATALIISDLIPGQAAIHTQSFWDRTNQVNARLKHFDGLSPQEIMDWLRDNDVSNSSGSRQYGMASLDSDGNPQAAAFTGADCFDVKYHVTGDYYAIQGNILIDSAVITDMETAFLNTQGSLAERLMAAMQGANRPGADSRCLSEGVSSRSAFLRVARPDDPFNNFFLDLHVPVTPLRVEPIDILQDRYDAWKISTETDNTISKVFDFKISPNPTADNMRVDLENFDKISDFKIEISDLTGKKLVEKTANEKVVQFDLKELNPGVYFVSLKNEAGQILISKKLIIN